MAIVALHGSVSMVDGLGVRRLQFFLLVLFGDELEERVVVRQNFVLFRYGPLIFFLAFEDSLYL